MGLESLTKVPRPAGLLGDSSQHQVVILLRQKEMVSRGEQGFDGMLFSEHPGEKRVPEKRGCFGCGMRKEW